MMNCSQEIPKRDTRLKHYSLSGLGLILDGLFILFTCLFVSGIPSYPSLIVQLVVYYFVVVVLGMIFQIIWQATSGPAYHNSKNKYYLTPLLFLAKKGKHWEIHGGQLYDFLYLRSKGMLSRECIREYYDARKAVSAIASLVKSGEIPSSGVIEVSSHFINDDVMKRIQKTIGIPCERVTVPKWRMLPKILMRFPIIAPDIVLKYYLTNGRMPRWRTIQNIFQAPTYIIRLDHLSDI